MPVVNMQHCIHFFKEITILCARPSFIYHFNSSKVVEFIDDFNPREQWELSQIKLCLKGVGYLPPS